MVNITFAVLIRYVFARLLLSRVANFLRVLFALVLGVAFVEGIAPGFALAVIRFRALVRA